MRIQRRDHERAQKKSKSKHVTSHSSSSHGSVEKPFWFTHTFKTIHIFYTKIINKMWVKLMLNFPFTVYHQNPARINIRTVITAVVVATRTKVVTRIAIILHRQRDHGRIAEIMVTNLKSQGIRITSIQIILLYFLFLYLYSTYYYWISFLFSVLIIL